LSDLRSKLLDGLAIPAHPLALNAARKLDEKRQRALTRYYLAAGAGGIAVGVHTTQFEIRDPRHGLLRPVLELAIEEMQDTVAIKIAGACGSTSNAVGEANLAASLGYDAVLLSLGALQDAAVPALIEHVRAVASIIPVIGFYLQPSVGGRILPFKFWREFVEIENVLAIKIAPFNRYQTLDVARAVVASGRASQIALYTGNDDNILVDLLSRYDFCGRSVRIVGGLLGHWAVWTSKAVEHLNMVRTLNSWNDPVPQRWLSLALQITDANAAIFDPANSFHGCIPGIHEILRRQGLLEGRWCLDPNEELSPGQMEEIDRVCRLYPHLQDDTFVRDHLEQWLR
jgi:dihydrodipicolinate synthase/N-acetylneuraminate lyase